MKSLTECFKTILTGDCQASRVAARQVRKLVYSSATDRAKYDDIKRLIDSAPIEYAKISASENWRQENFVMAISVMYFLHDKESQPDFLFPWLFNLLQHENGYIRHAAVRMLENELGPLTYHIRFPGEKLAWRHEKLSPERADRILYELFANLTITLNDLWKPVYKKYKYIRSLPTGPYKSIQMILGELTEDCGDKYMEKLEKTIDMNIAVNRSLYL
ncbi:MAG: hypothetical protein WCK03_00375 [Candidatus Taylorbacteria bacterium]